MRPARKPWSHGGMLNPRGTRPMQNAAATRQLPRGSLHAQGPRVIGVVAQRKLGRRLSLRYPCLVLWPDLSPCHFILPVARGCVVAGAVDGRILHVRGHPGLAVFRLDRVAGLVVDIVEPPMPLGRHLGRVVVLIHLKRSHGHLGLIPPGPTVGDTGVLIVLVAVGVLAHEAAHAQQVHLAEAVDGVEEAALARLLRELLKRIGQRVVDAGVPRGVGGDARHRFRRPGPAPGGEGGLA
mmetsp:Transcript_10847/g.29427  ORF Transcript_10847/g.29427 Transcript_10847/m.29427 type:complete len:238 (-) Transcript_10847:8-721(-)